MVLACDIKTWLQPKLINYHFGPWVQILMKFYHNTMASIPGNAFENAVCKMAVILSQNSKGSNKWKKKTFHFLSHAVLFMLQLTTIFFARLPVGTFILEGIWAPIQYRKSISFEIPVNMTVVKPSYLLNGIFIFQLTSLYTVMSLLEAPSLVEAPPNGPANCHKIVALPQNRSK